MEDAVRVLRGGGGAKTPGGVGVDTDLARQEFISGGQQVRLVAAVHSGAELECAAVSTCCP